MAYYNGYYYKRSFKGFFTYLFLAVMVVIIVAAIPTKEDFTHNNNQGRTGSGQTENKTNNKNKSLGQKDPAQYEEQNYYEWTNPAEF